MIELEKRTINVLLLVGIVLITIGSCAAFGLAIGTLVLGCLSLVMAMILIGVNI